jgi:mono/diheme cytochrome c family protein
MRLAVILVSVLLVSCSESKDQTPPSTSEIVDTTALYAETRWYSAEQVSEGRVLFAQYCAACHGANAEATPDWKTPTADGNYPPPPLNGSAHAWHHPIAVLDQVIRDGGAPVGGVMPAWGSILNGEQRLALIASFQDYWSEEIYEIWLERERAFNEY